MSGGNRKLTVSFPRGPWDGMGRPWSLFTARSASTRELNLMYLLTLKVELKEERAKNALKTTILKPGEIFDLASFNRYRYRNIFNVRYS